MFTVFKYIKAAQFFPDYCPTIHSFKHKLRGKDGHGNPTAFTPAEIKLIREGVKKLCHELSSGAILKELKK